MKTSHSEPFDIDGDGILVVEIINDIAERTHGNAPRFINLAATVFIYATMMLDAPKDKQAEIIENLAKVAAGRIRDGSYYLQGNRPALN